MNLENRLGLVKRTLHLLLDQLSARDQVGIVTCGSRAQVLEHTGDRERVRRAIDRPEPGGAANRVILATDGVANVGQTGPEAILREIGEYRSDQRETCAPGRP